MCPNHVTAIAFGSNKCFSQICALTRNVGFCTVIMVPTVITPYSTVQITVSQNYGVRPYKDGATVPYDFDHNLAVWLQFRPKTIIVYE